MVKGQRTKGNTKPSSSGRTAEMLAQTGNTSTFVAFSTVNSTDDQTKDDDQLNLDAEFRVVLKKMLKKDSITKIKALQEFAELCQDKSEDDVKPVLSHWPRLYNKLAVDYDCRVREATHKAHQQFVLKVGRNIAPQLKIIMAVWLTSQFDSYSPAASSATNSFNSAFPPSKRCDVLLFSKDVIINYITNMLLNEDSQSVADYASSTPEENQLKYNRLVSNCIQGLTYLIEAFPETSVKDCHDMISNLLNNKFWKLAKVKDPLIRSSWYRLISCFAKHFPTIANSNANKICSLTLGCLNENDPLVAPAVWESALFALITIEDSWKHVNFKKAFYPQFRSILLEGGRGNASILFPNLLPLLSRIPFDSYEESIKFYKDFFVFLREGLNKVINKQSECNAIIKAYMECLRYSISFTTPNSDDKQRKEFMNCLINEELLQLINVSLSGNDSISKSILCNETGLLLKYLIKEEPKNENYSNLIELLFNGLESLCLIKINEYDVNSLPLISRLLFNLFCEKNVNKEEKRIRFRRESDDDLSKSIQSIKLSEVLNDERCIKLLNVITENVISSYQLDNYKCGLLKLLLDLMKIHTDKTFSKLSHFNNGDYIEIFWTDYLNNWIEKQRLSVATNDKMEDVRQLIDIVLILSSFTAENPNKIKLLNYLISVSDPYLLECLFSKILHTSDKNVKEWLNSELVGNAIARESSHLIRLSIEMTSSNQTEIDVLWKLISYCFETNLIKNIYLEEIIEKLRIAITSNRSSSSKIEYLLNFTCRLAQQLFTSHNLCTSLLSAKSLLLALFSLNCNLCSENQQLTDAWKKGVSVIVKSNGAYMSEDSVISALALQVRSCLQGTITNPESAKMTYSCAYELIASIYETLNILNDENQISILCDPNIIQLLDLMLLSELEWQELERKCELSVLHISFLNNDTHFNFENCDIVENDAIIENENSPLIYSSITSSYLLQKILCHSSNDSNISSQLEEILVSQLKHLIFAAAYASAKSKLFIGNAIHANFITLTELLTDILKTSSFVKNLNLKITKILIEASIENGLFYTEALKYFLEFYTDKQVIEYTNFISLEDLSHNKIITFQICSSHIDLTTLHKVMTDSLNNFLCSENYASNEDIKHLSLVLSCLKLVDHTSQTVQENVINLIEIFSGLKENRSDLLFYDNDLIGDNRLQFCCLLIDSFSLFVQKWNQILTQTNWDLIICSATSWVINFINNKQKLVTYLPALIFGTKVLKLIDVISNKFDDIVKNESSNNYPQNLVDEWYQFHSKNIFGVLVPFFLQTNEIHVSYYCETFVTSLAKCVRLIPSEVIQDLIENLTKKDSLSLNLDKNDGSYQMFYLTPEKENVINNFCPLILNKYHPIAISSHLLVLKLLPRIIADVIQPEFANQQEEPSISPPKTLLTLLQQTDDIVDSLLMEFSIGDCHCIVKPQTDSFTYTFAYLLVWLEILELFAHLTDETRSQFASFLRHSSFLSRLLENLFRLMPLQQPNSQCLNLVSDVGSNNSFVEITNCLKSDDIQNIACFVYYLVLRRLPASVRQWWNNLDRKTSEVVNKFTSTYFSGNLCLQEVEAVQKADISQFKNMVVKARPSAREVLANYTIEEITIELLIQLPLNHPLGPVSVESGKRIGVSSSQWRTWLLQLTTFLTHQNGSILDGIILWKRNIDKRFEGIEECMICFYVLHGATYQLPKLQCKYCKKRYHSACLYKWFNTSNNSTCPLCRNLF